MDRSAVSATELSSICLRGSKTAHVYSSLLFNSMIGNPVAQSGRFLDVGDKLMNDKSRAPRLKRSVASIFHNAYTAWIVLLFGFAFTATAWVISSDFVEKNPRQQFENRVNDISTAIHNRMIGYEQVLWSTVGFFSATGMVDRERFHSYETSA